MATDIELLNKKLLHEKDLSMRELRHFRSPFTPTADSGLHSPELSRPGIFCFLSASTVWDCKNVYKIARSEGHQNAEKIAVISPSKNKLFDFCI